MELSALDITAFVGFIGVVIGISLYASRKEDTSEDYFLAGRALTWWLIGFSLIASNISSEHFVGMAGQGFDFGLAVASYEWIAAITLVFVAIFLLPRFLRSGIYTIPEFLEYRYNAGARAIMSVYMMVMYVLVAIAAVVFAGAKAIEAIFDMNMVHAIWLIGALAAAYTIYGGLKAVVWSDLLQGAALLLGGAIVMVLGFSAVGGVGAFFEANEDKLHMVLPASHESIPWTALIVGIWIPNIFYWGLNQFITQRTLGAKTLSQGQNGIIFAAFIKLLIPFIIVFPGIMAFQLYGNQIDSMDHAYPFLMRKILPAGLRGIMFAALFGAVMSSLDSMLNSASTILTMDLYKRHFRKDAGTRNLVLVGRVATGIFAIGACAMASYLAALPEENLKGIFTYIQKFQGFISPGIVTAFLFGLVVRKAPPSAAIAALLLNIPVYGFLNWKFDNIAFLNHMAITFAVLIAAMAVITVLWPLTKAVELPVKEGFDLRSSRLVKTLGAVVVILTVLLYIRFW